jgi:hypothetical protein
MSKAGCRSIKSYGYAPDLVCVADLLIRQTISADVVR